mmetsp:Transcript_13246/g.25374  ORF Transcript_13246/g.25374 Transcript_13246/m.25374 type:complete len:434 (+) Transcript_13246:146-1447(+)|eukprot:CAMPEP_0114245294 /NCGR_PEP_ID=MMETSP0058-20121206/11812_1 /TAXON_ID=36894 /ORGANISM="Pyramimonas parkeae, CCMP726" /LENGTH=433 /DNA_ID=CAMNT_0001358323 /DNA_START=132 /DNA_END=1433 /DNA_ORIENTATION=-
MATQDVPSSARWSIDLDDALLSSDMVLQTLACVSKHDDRSVKEPSRASALRYRRRHSGQAAQPKPRVMLSADYNAALKQETTTAAHGHEAVRDPIKPARAKEAASSPAAPARPQSPGPSAGAGQGRPRALSLSVEIPSSDKQETKFADRRGLPVHRTDQEQPASPHAAPGPRRNIFLNTPAAEPPGASETSAVSDDDRPHTRSGLSVEIPCLVHGQETKCQAQRGLPVPRSDRSQPPPPPSRPTTSSGSRTHSHGAASGIDAHARKHSTNSQGSDEIASEISRLASCNSTPTSWKSQSMCPSDLSLPATSNDGVLLHHRPLDHDMLSLRSSAPRLQTRRHSESMSPGYGLTPMERPGTAGSLVRVRSLPIRGRRPSVDLTLSIPVDHTNPKSPSASKARLLERRGLPMPRNDHELPAPPRGDNAPLNIFSSLP